MNNKVDRRTFAWRAGLGMAAAFCAPRLAQAESGAAVKPQGLKLRPLSKSFLARLPKIMEIANVPGVAVAYIENGKLAYTGDFGLRNAESKVAVTSDTVWQVGSLSKPVFALAVMKLAQSGKIDLDRPLASYVPGELIKDEPRAKLITARHALSHSTGLQNWRFRAGENLQMSFAPGERWSYSGEGIYYLQRAVEEIIGQGFAQFMKETVLDPLQMSSSTYFWLANYGERLATAHNTDGRVAIDYVAMNATRMQKVADEWNKPVETWRASDFEKAQAQVENRFPPFPTFFSVNAAGTLNATTADYAKFIAAMFDPKLDEMFRPQQRINNSIAWGLGWGLQTDGPSPQFWHWGEGINYRTFVMGDRASRSAIIVFTNARNGRKVWERIVTEAAGDQSVLVWV